MINEYSIINDNNPDRVASRVQNMLSAGWQPHGGLCAHGDGYTSQAMIRIAPVMVDLKRVPVNTIFGQLEGGTVQVCSDGPVAVKQAEPQYRSLKVGEVILLTDLVDNLHKNVWVPVTVHPTVAGRPTTKDNCLYYRRKIEPEAELRELVDGLRSAYTEVFKENKALKQQLGEDQTSRGILVVERDGAKRANEQFRRANYDLRDETRTLRQQLAESDKARRSADHSVTLLEGLRDAKMRDAAYWQGRCCTVIKERDEALAHVSNARAIILSIFTASISDIVRGITRKEWWQPMNDWLHEQDPSTTVTRGQ